MKRARSVDKFERLMETVVEDSSDLARALLRDGALADQADEQGTTALMLANENGHVGCVRALLEAGAPLAQAKQSGATHHCADAGVQQRPRGFTSVRALLEAGAPVEQGMQDGTSALILACQFGHVDCVARCSRLVQQWRSPGRTDPLR
jgi:ankyrin repeat protein